MKVLFVGLTTLDIINVCDYFPSEDEDLRVKSQSWTKGGNAANSACVLSQHKNIEVDILTYLSGRKEQQFVVEQLRNSGVNIDKCPVNDTELFPTSTCIINTKNGSRTILHHRGEFPELSFEDIEKFDLSQYDWIHFEGRNVEVVAKMMELIIKFRAQINQKKPIISGEMEKTKRLEDLFEFVLPFVDVLFVSKDIALAINQNSPSDCTLKITKNPSLSASIVICPWGEIGVSAMEKIDNSWSEVFCTSLKVKAIDTLGAGDTLIAGVIYKLLEKASLKESIEYGNTLAGTKCGQLGFDNVVENCNTLFK